MNRSLSDNINKFILNKNLDNYLLENYTLSNWIEEILNKDDLINFYELYIKAAISYNIIVQFITNSNYSKYEQSIITNKINNLLIYNNYPKAKILEEISYIFYDTKENYKQLIYVLNKTNYYPDFYLKKDQILNINSRFSIKYYDINKLLSLLKEINPNTYYKIISMIDNNISNYYYEAYNNNFNKIDSDNITFINIENNYLTKKKTKF